MVVVVGRRAALDRPSAMPRSRQASALPTLLLATVCARARAECASWCDLWNCHEHRCSTCTTEHKMLVGCLEGTKSPPPHPPMAQRPSQDKWGTGPVRTTPPKTRVGIRADEWTINGKPTFEGKSWKGVSMQGLLPNARMVNAVFDDMNEQTKHLWAYPDTNKWDPERNTAEMVEARVGAAVATAQVTVQLDGGQRHAAALELSSRGASLGRRQHDHNVSNM